MIKITFCGQHLSVNYVLGLNITRLNLWAVLNSLTCRLKRDFSRHKKKQSITQYLTISLNLIHGTVHSHSDSTDSSTTRQSEHEKSSSIKTLDEHSPKTISFFSPRYWIFVSHSGVGNANRDARKLMRTKTKKHRWHTRTRRPIVFNLNLQAFLPTFIDFVSTTNSQLIQACRSVCFLYWETPPLASTNTSRRLARSGQVNHKLTRRGMWRLDGTWCV